MQHTDFILYFNNTEVLCFFSEARFTYVIAVKLSLIGKSEITVSIYIDLMGSK